MDETYIKVKGQWVYLYRAVVKEHRTPAASTGRCRTSIMSWSRTTGPSSGDASQGFRSFWAAWRTLAGYEIIQMIRKGQACGNALAARVGLLHRFIVGMLGIGSLIHLVYRTQLHSIPKLQHYRPQPNLQLHERHCAHLHNLPTLDLGTVAQNWEKAMSRLGIPSDLLKTRRGVQPQ